MTGAGPGDWGLVRRYQRMSLFPTAPGRRSGSGTCASAPAGKVTGVAVRWLLRPLLALSLLFYSGYVYGAQGSGAPFTGAVFSSAATSSGNTFTTPSSFTVTGLIALGIAGPPAGVKLDWAPVGWGTGYNVYRGLSANTISLSPLNASPLAAGTATYLDTTAEIGTNYHYTVRALNSRGVLGLAATPVPATLSTDTVAPTLLSLSPAGGTLGVGTDTKISATFSEPMNTASVVSALSLVPCTDGTCTTTSSPVTFTAPSWNGTNSAVQLTPSGLLSGSTYYKLSVSSGAIDLAGLPLQNPSSAIFRTSSTLDTISPQVLPPTYPADGAVNVPLNVAIVIPFSEAMQQSTTQSAISVVCASGQTGCVEPSPSGYTFSWNSAGSVVTFYPGMLSASKRYLLEIKGAAKDLAGNLLSGVSSETDIAFSAELFTTGTTVDSSPPIIVPPTTPVHGETGVPTNSSIIIRFSEAMQQDNTASAIVVSCTSGASCPAPLSPLTFTWNTSGTTVAITHGGMFASSSYTVSLGSAARDLVGNAMCSPGPVCASFSFITGAGPDSTPPGAVTITSPTVEAWTVASTYPVSGTAPENTLQVKVWRDANGNGLFDPTDDPLVTTVQLYGTLTTFSIDVPLAPGQANKFLLTASDVAGNQSGVVVLPTINQGDRRTTPGTVTGSPGNNTLTAYAPFSGDLAVAGNTQNTAVVEWSKTGVFDPGATCVSGDAGKCSMTRSSEQFTYTLQGLSTNTTFHVRVTFTDPDGIVGGASQMVMVTTLGGSQTGFLSDLILSRPRIASASPQTTAIVFSVPASVDRVQVTIKNSNNVVVRDFGCYTPPDPVSPATTVAVSFTWDGKNGAGQFVPDGVYSVIVEAAAANTCGSNAEQQVGGFVVVSNVTSISLSPAPGSITLGSGDSVIVVATVRNARNELVADGVPVSWSAQGSSTNNFTLTGATSGSTSATSVTGASYAECSVSPGSGRACVRLTVGAAVTQTITVTASVASQDTTAVSVPVATRMVSASTTVNDPPAPPTGLELSLGSVRMRWNPSPDPRVTGYVVAIGSQSRQYETAVDVGLETSYRYLPVEAGKRYYVTIRSYDRNGQLSPLGEEASILIPLSPAGTATSTAAASSTAPSSAAVTSPTAASSTATVGGEGGAVAGKTATAIPGGAPDAAPSASAGPNGSSATSTPSPTGAWMATPSATATGLPSATSTATPTTTGVVAGTPTPATTVAPVIAPGSTATATLYATTTVSPPATSTGGPTALPGDTVPTSTHTPVPPPTPPPPPASTPTPVPTNTPPASPTVAAPATPTLRPEPSATASVGP
jgi:hypothetical protein